MLGWSKKRQRREHLKLLKQNELAAQYLLKAERTSIELGITTDGQLSDILELAVFGIHDCQSNLQSYQLLPPKRVDEQLQANRNLRKLYDGLLLGRQAFARRFGTSSEKIEYFDAKFQPNEGWTNYFAHFGESLEEKFKSVVK